MNEKFQYWFPAKRYGWGWGLPQTWQGWVAFVVWLAALFGGIWALRFRFHPLIFIPFVLVMVAALRHWRKSGGYRYR